MASLYFKVGADYDKVIRLREEIKKLKSELSGMDGNTSPAVLRTMETQLAKNTKEMDALIVSAAKAGNEITQNFKKKIFDASQSVNGFTEKIIAQKAVIKDTEADVKRLGEAYRIALKRNPMSANGKLLDYTSAKKALDEDKSALFQLTQQQSEARLSVKKLRDEYALYKNEGKQVVETNNGIAISWKKALAVIGGVGALKALSSEIIRVRGEFQSMHTAIETMVGKDVAEKLIPQIKELAKISPLTMTDMVGAEKMMLGFNIQAEDTIKYLKALSDISMGESSKFNSLTLAFSQMSAAGKLMGQDLNQMINAGFNPLQIIAEKTGKSIATLKDEMSKGAISAEMVQQAFIDATSAGGKFFGMSENASKTINGQISMMQDALDNVFNELGTKGESVIMSGIKATTSLIQNYETVGKVLAGLVATYGAYRTAVMLVTAAESKHTLVEIGLTNARILARKAQLALNASMLANPYVAITALVVGLVAAMWALSESTSAAEEAQKMFSDRLQRIEDNDKKRKEQIDKLIAVIQDETAAEIDRLKAIQELRKIVPEATKDMSDEAIQTEELTAQKKKYNEELSRQIGLEKQRELNRLYAQKKNLESSIKIDRGTKGYKYQYRADQDQLILDEVEKQIAKLEKEKASFFNLKEKINQSTSTSSITKEIEDATKKISDLKQELADLRSGKTTVEAGKTVKEVIEGKVKELKSAEDALSTLTGKDKSSDKKLEDEQKKQLEKQKAIYKELLDLRLQNQQAEINLMADGSEKKIKQINLDYDKEIAAILAKEKEWKDAQGGKLTEEQTVEIRTSLVQSYVKREKSTGLVSSEQLAEEKRMMNEYLKEYGTYLEKRQAITELYNERIAKATTEGERKSLSEAMKRELSDLDIEVSKTTSAISRLFGDMKDKTLSELEAINRKGREALEFLKSGVWDESKGKDFGITKEMFELWSKSPDKLKDISDALKENKEAADKLRPAYEKVAKGLKGVFEAGSDTKKLRQAIDDIEEGLGEIMQAGQFLADTFTNLGDAFGSDLMSGIADGLNVAMDAMDSAMQGAKAGAMFGQIGMAAGAAIGVVSSLAASIAKIHDKKNEKRIERLQDQIETLDKSYQSLDKAINKAYSNDASKLIEDQNKLLEQQKVLIQRQIREEEDKKKTDNERIKEWREQIDEINDTIADNKEAGKDAIFGSDIKSAIDDFASAYAEAWAAGEDKAQSAKDLVKKMIKNMVTESIKAAASDPMKAIREKLLEFWSDDYISDWEQDYLDRKAQDLVDQLDRKFGWADKYFKTEDVVDEDSGRTASSKGIGSISQDSADVIDGKMSTQLIFLDRTLVQVTGIADQMRFIHDLQTRGWKDVEAIKDLSGKVSENTAKVAEISGRIETLSEKIEANTKSAASGIKTINDKGVLMRSR